MCYEYSRHFAYVIKLNTWARRSQKQGQCIAAFKQHTIKTYGTEKVTFNGFYLCT